MRLVLDTSVIVSAFRSRSGASFRLLEMCRQGHHTILATPTLFFEYESVLLRKEHQAVHGLSLSEVDEALRGIASLVEAVKIDFQWKPQLRDAGDEFVLEAAINGKADIICTHNLRDFLPAATRFGLRVLSPASMIRLRSW
jgi:putative PIN family toxin of toxin-antitoxin system